MAKYYAIERSSAYLKHYGVKGMRWGVRKAIESGDSRKLDKAYKKAVGKARKLNTKANISRSQQEYKGRMSDAATLGLTGAVTAGVPFALRSVARKAGVRAIGVGRIGLIPVAYDSETTPYVTGALGAGMGAMAAYNLGKGIAAKRRTTVKGHAKAKAKAQNFRNEMKSAFKGTKYSKLPGADRIDKPYNYESTKTQLKNAGIDSVTYPGYTMTKKAVGNTGKKRRNSK